MRRGFVGYFMPVGARVGAPPATPENVQSPAGTILVVVRDSTVFAEGAGLTSTPVRTLRPGERVSVVDYPASTADYVRVRAPDDRGNLAIVGLMLRRDLAFPAAPDVARSFMPGARTRAVTPGGGSSFPVTEIGPPPSPGSPPSPPTPASEEGGGEMTAPSPLDRAGQLARRVATPANLVIAAGVGFGALVLWLVTKEMNR